METIIETNSEPVPVSTNLDQSIENLVPENSNHGDFEQKLEVSADEMRRIIEVMASTGKFWHDWIFLRGILSYKLKQVLAEYPEQNSLVGETYSELVKKLNDELLSFEEGPPFTLQRLCEILLDPKSTYLSLSKLALALEKNLLVTSTLTRCTDPYPTINTSNMVPNLEINASNMAPNLEINASNISPTLEINSSNISPTLEINASNIVPSLEINPSNMVPNLEVNTSNIVPTLEIINPNPNPNISNGVEANSVDQPVASDFDEEMPDAEPEPEKEQNPNPNIPDVEMQDEEKVIQEEEKVTLGDEKLSNDETGTVPVETGMVEQGTGTEPVVP